MKSGRIGRRDLLKGSSFIAGVAIAGAVPSLAGAEEKQAPAWDLETDVVCVGSGAAGLSAAVAATDAGAKAIVLEALPIIGGTTQKSGGVFWIPNNFTIRANGKVDAKSDCLRYIARFAYPQQYSPDSPQLGLDDHCYSLIETMYDQGTIMVDRFREIGAINPVPFDLGPGHPVSDYAGHLPENKLPIGRALVSGGGNAYMGGTLLIKSMETWLRAKSVSILTSHRARKLVYENGQVTGIEVDHNGVTLRIRARKGVCFGSGGYAHNKELTDLYQTSFYGACARAGSRGDIIAMTGAIGARMGTLGTAWRAQVVLDEAIENDTIVATEVFVPAGDSMIIVNRRGERVVDEKRDYCSRGRVHFAYDPVAENYPNQVLFMFFDSRTQDRFGGNYPVPTDVRESPYLISGETVEELTKNIEARLAKYATRIGHFSLAPNFPQGLKTTIVRYNKFARQGRDEDFSRGAQSFDVDWDPLYSSVRKGTKTPDNNMPNRTMYPIAGKGPYYAFMLGAGGLDTSGGPMINARAEIVDYANKPIPGVYGAGNCVASPSREAYCGAGATIGLAMTFGYLGGRNAATRS
jgi:hypothetical protein